MQKRLNLFVLPIPVWNGSFLRKSIILWKPCSSGYSRNSSKKEQAINYFQLDEKKKTILVIGGSLGARTINESIAGSLSLFSEKNIQLIWQTGARFAAEAKNRAKENNNVKVKPFITKMTWLIQ